MSDSGDSRMTVQDYRRMLRRRWRTIVLVVAVVLGLAAAYVVVQEPKYVGQADVLLEPTAVDLQVSGTSEINAEEIATQVQVATSQPVQDLIRAKLGADTPVRLANRVSAQPVGQSRVIRITASAMSADAARTLVQAVADSFLTYRSQEAQRILDESSQALREERAAALKRIADIQKLITKPGADREVLDVERRNLLSKASELSSRIDALSSPGTGISGGRVLAVDAVSTPVSPRPLQTGLLALVFGLFLGFVVALLRDRVDSVLRDAESFDATMDPISVPVLGRVRTAPGSVARDGVVVLEAPEAAASKDLHSVAVHVRHGLRQQRRGDQAGMVLVTSPGSKDGRTMVVGNLVNVLARQGLQVIEVQADFGRPVSAEDRAKKLPGLSDVLVTDDDPAAYLVRTETKNLRRLPAGRLAEQGDDLLAGPRVHEVMKMLAEAADLIVVGAPARTAVSAIELLPDVDLGLVVARRGTTRASDAARLAVRLRRLGLVQLGGVLLDVRRSDEERSIHRA
jgi:capsular polysaccharide biosynthesis protein/Mrp family chromosome partitioning ATPase